MFSLEVFGGHSLGTGAGGLEEFGAWGRGLRDCLTDLYPKAAF